MKKVDKPDGKYSKKVVILGHTGLIGRHLFDYFRDKHPDLEVIGRSFPPTDLTKPSVAAEVSELFNLETTVILLSAIKRQFGDSLDSFTQNLNITTNLCRVLESKPVRLLIYFSSAAVYGEDVNNLEISENTPVCPTSFYGMMKFISERLLWKTFEQNDKCFLIVVRPPTIYGPGDEGDTYGPVKFVNADVNNDDVTLWGDGNELREFVYIDDIVRIIHHLAFSNFEGVLNLASGRSYSFLDVLKTVESVSEKSLQINSRQRTKAKVDNAFINNRLIKEVGNIEFTSIADGIKALLNSRISKEI